MYGTTGRSVDFRGRVGSQSTKPRRDLSDLAASAAGEMTREVERLSLADARHEQSRLKERLCYLQTKKVKGAEQSRVCAALGSLRRHIGMLTQQADASDDYSALVRALREVCGGDVAARVMARKLEIQSEVGDILATRVKSNGKARKPVQQRRGGTLEQALRRAIVDGC